MTSDAAPIAAAAAAKATGRRRRHRSEHSPMPTSSGPFTHHADSRTNTAVSHGCSKAGAASTSARSRSSRGDIAETEPQASRAARLILVVNGRASGIEDPQRMADELLAVLEELGADAESAVTYSEQELWDVLRFAAEFGWRVVLVGGDGTLHAAANAPLRAPARACARPRRPREQHRPRARHPHRTGRTALAVAANAPPGRSTRCAWRPPTASSTRSRPSAPASRPRRAPTTRPTTRPTCARGCGRSCGRSGATGPTAASVRVDGEAIRSSSAAQLFFSNLPFFGFGFEVAPGRRSGRRAPRGDRPRGARPHAGCCGCSPPPGAGATSAGAA